MKGKRPEPSAENSIGAFFHCRRCLNELPVGTSPREWARLEAGWTAIGFQVWCQRHDVNVLHVDFEGCRHPANLSEKGDKP
jgi:hypothetical protein